MLRVDTDTTILSSTPSTQKLNRDLRGAAVKRAEAIIAREELLAARREERLRKRMEDPNYVPPVKKPKPGLTAEQQDIIDSAMMKRARRAELLRDRYNRGYVFAGGAIGTLHQPGFIFEGLKSHDHPLLQAFNATLPRKKNLKSGWSKEFVDGGADSKVMALDLPYVEGNKVVLGFMRIDLDAIFTSWGHLKFLIEDLGVLMPHIGVAGMLKDGRIRNPHLIWLLPIGNGIWTGEKALRSPVALYKAVGRGLCQAMLSLGADPGGLSNLMRVKNPLSPHWSTCILNDSTPMSLSYLSSWVDLNVKSEVLAQAHVELSAERDGIPAVESNQAFLAFRTAAFETLRGWHRSNDPRIDLRDRDALCVRLMFALRHQARAALSGGQKPKQAMAILQKVCVFAASAFDPKKVGKARPNAGVLRGNLVGVTSLQERQQAGGKHSAQVRRERAVKVLADYLERNADVTKSQAARDLIMSRRNVIRLWDQAVAMVALRQACDKRYIVKKNGCTSDLIKDLPSLPSDSSSKPSGQLANHHKENIIMNKPKTPSMPDMTKVARFVAKTTANNGDHHEEVKAVSDPAPVVSRVLSYTPTRPAPRGPKGPVPMPTFLVKAIAEHRKSLR